MGPRSRGRRRAKGERRRYATGGPRAAAAGVGASVREPEAGAAVGTSVRTTGSGAVTTGGAVAMARPRWAALWAP